jgi:hypothetical protein
MTMAELKTKPTDQDVAHFLEGIEDEQQRNDCLTIVELMRDVTGAEPKMWGTSIVGFGDRQYSYASGRSGDWFVTGFSPRKQNLTLYLAGGIQQHQAILDRLGKYSTGKGCLYIKRLSNIDPAVLRELVEQTVAQSAGSNAG